MPTKSFFIFFLLISINSFCQSDLDLNDKLLPVSSENILKSTDYYTWGSSVVKGDDGKYYMFYSRWPHGERKLDDDSLNYIFNGFRGWNKYSEIACAVSDKLTGPYRYVTTVLKGTGDKSRWDRFTYHNPLIKKFGEWYYLYFISNSFDSSYTLNRATSKENLQWLKYNCTQKIGVVKAKSIEDLINGRYKKPATCLMAPDNKQTFEVATNPSVTKGPDGKYFMMYKSRLPNVGHMTFWIAVADKPDGPYTTVSAALTSAEMASEDPTIWYDKKRKCFYAVAKYFSHNKKYGFQFGSLILIYSKDGKAWSLAKHSEVSKKELTFKNGKRITLDHLERPFIYCDKNGTPLTLFAAASVSSPFGGDVLHVTDDRNTFNVCIPLRH